MDEQPKYEIYLCPNCGIGTLVTYDKDGQPNYEHITFDRKEGIDFARFTCKKKEN